MNEEQIRLLLATRPNVTRKEIEEYEELRWLSGHPVPGTRITRRRHRQMKIRSDRQKELWKKLFG